MTSPDIKTSIFLKPSSYLDNVIKKYISSFLCHDNFENIKKI